MTTPRAREAGARSRRRVDVDDALRWIEAHCRYAKTMIPRGVVGVEAAIEYLHHLPEACRRRLPDLTGSAPSFAADAVRLGLLATTPSEKVARSLPRLIASVSPVIVPRSPRIWTGWIVHLLDPEMQALLRERTPASQLEVAVVVEAEPGISRRTLRRRLAELDGEVERLTAERDQLVADKRAALDELRSTRREAADYRARVDPLLSAQDQTIARLQAECDTLRAHLEKAAQHLVGAHEVQVSNLARLDRIEAELRDASEARRARLEAAEQQVATLTAENTELQARLARWGSPTPILLPATPDQQPGWHATFSGRKVWIHAGSGRLGSYELHVEAPGAPARIYSGLLGQVVLLVHLIHAGESEEEAGKIARVTRRRR